ncbi:MAG: hypothetical protein KF678_09760 [Phycisphaeraceae bacterium]|nr:hypothetical protein [Phycisphaeraceae bacterium]
MERRAAVWMAPDQVELVKEVAAAAGLSIAHAGSWGRGLSTSVAEELGAAPIRDVRSALASAEVDLFWIASAGAFGAGNAVEDGNAVSDAHARNVKIASIEPIPAAALDLLGGGWLEGTVKPVDVVRLVPRMSEAKWVRNAADVLESFGSIRTAVIQSWGAPAHGSLGAHLFSALDLALSLMGEPETIDAACAVLSAGKTVRAMPGETLRDLHGDITASLRYADGRAAGVMVSDQAGRWGRSITLLGDKGRLRIHDDGLEWIGPDGALVDESKPKRTKKGELNVSPAAAAMAESLARLLEPGVQDMKPGRQVETLTLCQTALLSARTGQGESPSTIRRMVGVD